MGYPVTLPMRLFSWNPYSQYLRSNGKSTAFQRCMKLGGIPFDFVYMTQPLASCKMSEWCT